MILFAVLVVVVFLMLLVLGMPVFLAMGFSGLLGLYLTEGPDQLLENFALSAYNGLSSFVLLAVPLYVLAGCLLEASGLSRRLFDFAAMMVSRLRGGLSVATVLACTIFAAISGSSVATAATIGLVAFPTLTRYGYRREQTGALIAAGGTLGIMIPPSIAFILYGLLTDQSVGALFVAGIVPGLLLSLFMAMYTSAFSAVESTAHVYSWAERKEILKEAIPVLLLPALIFVGIYSGLATATEIAGIAVVYTLAIGLLLRTLTVAKIKSATSAALRSSVMIFVLVAFGSILTQFFTMTGVPQAMTALIADSGLPHLAIFSLIVLFYLILGMFLEALSMMLITIPILYPVAQSLGISPLAFGVIVVLAVETAQITPPVGINLFTVASIGKVRFDQLSRAVIPYVLLLLGMMYLVYLVPGIATWMPGTMNYGR